MPTISPATARLLGQTVNVNFSATTGWGTRPAVLTLTAPSFAFDNSPGQVSDLTIQCAGVELVWYDVRVASVEASEPNNAGLWRVTLEDRRWKWQFGHIDGDYNVVNADGTLKRERNPRELATLLGAAMGEPGIDTTGLPTAARPRKAWRAHSARDELDRLCNDYGCAIAFDGPGDAARIVRVGSGQPFIDPAQYGGRVTRSDGKAIPAWPSQIRVITAPVIFQTELQADEPIGEDTDGTIKPIDELSYAPAGGWFARLGSGLFAQVNGFYVRDGKTLYVRELAEKCVFKWWRFTAQVIGGWSPLALQGSPYAPSSLDDIGPFLGTRAERDSGSGNRLPIVVQGQFFDHRQESLDNTTGIWPFGARINQETKAIELERQAFLMNTVAGLGIVGSNAVLRVLCAYEVSKNGIPIRYEKWRDNDGPHYGAGPRVEHHEEITREIIERNVAGAVQVANDATDNIASVNAEADFYLDSIAAEYQVRPTAQIEVPLIQHFPPDGVLRQVKWEGGSEQAPTTSLSYNSEISDLHPNYRDTPAQRARREAEQAARQREALRQGKVKLGLN